mgnify:CR=1 FL=1
MIPGMTVRPRKSMVRAPGVAAGAASPTVTKRPFRIVTARAMALFASIVWTLPLIRRRSGVPAAGATPRSCPDKTKVAGFSPKAIAPDAAAAKNCRRDKALLGFFFIDGWKITLAVHEDHENTHGAGHYGQLWTRARERICLPGRRFNDESIGDCGSELIFDAVLTLVGDEP